HRRLAVMLVLVLVMAADHSQAQRNDEQRYQSETHAISFVPEFPECEVAKGDIQQNILDVPFTACAKSVESAHANFGAVAAVGLGFGVAAADGADEHRQAQANDQLLEHESVSFSGVPWPGKPSCNRPPPRREGANRLLFPPSPLPVRLRVPRGMPRRLTPSPACT